MVLTIRHYFLIITACIFIFFTPTLVNAQVIDMSVEQELYGWAWSDTIGWISMNCANLSECGSSSYSVVRNPSTGNLSGFAWSEHIGWIQFGGLPDSEIPRSGSNARINNGGIMAGWARALSGTDYDDGWDGWISFNGRSPDYGIRFEVGGPNAGSAASDSFAWGSVVVGWVDFSGVTLGVPVDPPTIDPTGTITGDDCLIAVGDSTCQTEIDWTITNATNPAVVGPTGVTISSNENGPQTVTLQRGSSTFQARDGSDVLASVTVSAQCVPGATWDGSQCIAVLPNLEPRSFNRSQSSFNDDGVANNTIRFRIHNIGATSTDAVGVNDSSGRVYHSLEVQDISNDSSYYVNGPRILGGDYSTDEDDFISGEILNGNNRPVTYSAIPLMFGHYRVIVTADPTPPSPFGRIQEANENNNRLERIITIRPPTFTPGLTVNPRIIRSGDNAELEWSGIPPWVTCVVSGAGLPGGSLSGTDITSPDGRFTLTNRTSSSRYQMVCTEPSTGETFTSPEARLEVLPRLEEI